MQGLGSIGQGMPETSLDRVLRLSGSAEEEPAGPDLRELVATAHSSLREAARTADPAVAAQLVLAALADLDGAAEQLFIEMAGPVPEDVLAFAAMSTAARKKPGAHTIAGSTDYPIPDVKHLHLAVGRYHAGQYAGHSKEEVAAHIRSEAKRLGVSVDLTDAQPGIPVLLELARGAAVAVPVTSMVSEHHGPMHGTHAHAHTHHEDNSHGMAPGDWGEEHVKAALAAQQHGAGIVDQNQNKATWGRLNMEQAADMHAAQHKPMTGTHSHLHTHLGDNAHGGRSDHSVATRMGQQEWKAKGEAAWAAHRQTWGQDAAAEGSGPKHSEQYRGAAGEAVGHREVTWRGK
jgi:hypothetical protein